MDGYSVQEAASVLGVAEGRVWELLARGVLFGTPEGESMRVFLKAQPGPIASAGTHDEPRSNGNGGSHATGEASAFRELLTEFRNLTERYGQALLALGEARGEVAGLRSRVDQLEARLDLRLPPPLEAGPVAWESSSGPLAGPEAAPPRQAARRTARPRKAPSPRDTVAGFADALARAQDPNAADLGEAPVDAEALGQVAAAPVEAVSALDEVMPEVAAEEVTIEHPPVEAPTYSAVVVEPDWFADGDFAWLDAAEMDASAAADAGTAEPAAGVPELEEMTVEPEAVAAAPEAVAAAPEAATIEPEPVLAEAEAVLEPQASPESEIAVEPAREPEAPPGPEAFPEREFRADEVQAAAAEPDREPAPVSEFGGEPDFEPWRPPEAAVPEASTDPGNATEPEPPTMSAAVAVEEAEEEVMWLGAEPGPIVQDEPPHEHRAEAGAWPMADVAQSTVEVARPPLAMTEDELARLALDEGWDEAEVAAIRAMITPPPPASRVDLPGAAELHEAMAALEAVPLRPDPVLDPSRQWAKPTPDDDEPATTEDWAFAAEPAQPPTSTPRTPTDVTAALRRTAGDPGWLRRSQGPAAAAYRRIRRLFPG